MPKQTAPNADAVTPEWLHDEIMSRVEPELMLANRDMVEDMYVRNVETKEERLERFHRYEKAYMRFREVLQHLEANSYEEFRTRKKGERREHEVIEKNSDSTQLENIQSDITNIQ